jgi:hypothetical protein
MLIALAVVAWLVLLNVATISEWPAADAVMYRGGLVLIGVIAAGVVISEVRYSHRK